MRIIFQKIKIQSLYLNLDTLISKISTEREKNSILKYDADKFHEKINELNNLYKDTTEKLKSIKNKEDLLLKSDDSREKVKRKLQKKNSRFG